MQLVDTQVTYYRSIEDSEQFVIEPDVTCLVGKNESGKTNVLQALYRLKPVEKLALDEVIDFPANLSDPRDDEDEKLAVVRARFRFQPEEVEQIELELGNGFLRSPEFTVTLNYPDSYKTFNLDYDESVAVAHLKSALDLSPIAEAAVGPTASIAELLDALEGLEEPPSTAVALAEKIRKWRKQSIVLHLIDKYASPMMPTFVYFGDYDIMPGKVSIPDLVARREADQLNRGEMALVSLLDMAGVKPEDFKKTDRHERLIRELERSGNIISKEVFRYWSQNTDLAVRLNILPVEDGAVAPYDKGPILQIRVWNQRHSVSVPFDDRSRGFVWFFSFLAYFNKLEVAGDTDLILLLDEPGLSLHGRAQEDLLKLIDNRLAPKHQVLYTTHSPFMVSPKKLHRVRTVVDQDEVGTKVSAEVLKADADTAFPLLAAMGIELTQTLFVGEDTLLVEGPSDMIYLDVLSDATETSGRTGLDPRWVKTPIGGSGKLSTFATLLGANQLNVAVLIDSSTQDTQAVQRLRDNGRLASNGLVEISEFTTAEDADIEDLFEPDFYLELVSQAFKADLSKPINLADLTGNSPRIAKRVEGYFQRSGIARGKNSHYKPAALLLREQAKFIPKLSDATLERAEQLFIRLNSLIRS
ncbi:AAA family ATPase [Nocardia sp. BSTN01]|uniref:AAA family ATPase n=1 Tax=Nocardia sp. BSTN01 TaxID=2783665 RepID=UPI0018906B28|nr:AAA family ATPase [Nocardia sp. BSTN01]MBF4996924.1 AAA family ATPase [Nocardia sp. BSTN01]